VAIVLAGGLSSRMPRFKPLLPLGKTTVTDHVIETFQRNDVDVILVGGYRREDLFAKISSRDILLCENPDYEQGCSHPFVPVLLQSDRDTGDSGKSRRYSSGQAGYGRGPTGKGI
jgi:CTP:molybdopterin cytidylyltransferase MocA